MAKKLTKQKSVKTKSFSVRLKDWFLKLEISSSFKGVLKKVLIWTSSLLVSGWLLVSFLKPPSFNQLIRWQVLRNSQNTSARLILIENYLENNQFSQAEKELLKLEKQDLNNWQTDKLANLWQKKQRQDPQEIEKQISHWQKQLEDRPDWRDAWLILSLLQAKLGKKETSWESLQKAKTLDPNYPLFQELEKN
jgi:tetratricopeptide (TPR) repeat protein